VSLVCFYFESRYEIREKIIQGKMSKQTCREVVGFSLSPAL